MIEFLKVAGIIIAIATVCFVVFILWILYRNPYNRYQISQRYRCEVCGKTGRVWFDLPEESLEAIAEHHGKKETCDGRKGIVFVD